jgi:hypothetical protein
MKLNLDGPNSFGPPLKRNYYFKQQAPERLNEPPPHPCWQVTSSGIPGGDMWRKSLEALSNPVTPLDVSYV